MTGRWTIRSPGNQAGAKHHRPAKPGTFLAGMLAAMIITAGLSGCEAVLIGTAAGAAGYAVADERSVGEITDDATITARVKRKLFADDEISALDVNVDTYQRKVTLSGKVPSATALARAVELARITKGVIKVDSQLTVTAPKSSG